MTEGKEGLYIEEHILAIVFSAILLLMFANVVCRYFFNYPLALTEEIIQMLFIWGSFLGAPVVCARGVNLSFDLFAKSVPVNKRKYVELLVQSLSIVLFAFLFYFGLRRTVNQISFNAVSNLLHLPLWAISAAIPIGSAFYIYRSARLIISAFKEGPQ